MGQPFCQHAWQDAALTLREAGWTTARIEEAIGLEAGEVAALVEGWREDFGIIQDKHHEMIARAMGEAGESHSQAKALAAEALTSHYTAWTGRKLSAAAARELGLT
jgi:hypothetical protein